VQKLEPLRRQFTGKNSNASGISTRSVKTRDEAEPNRIIPGVEDDGDSPGYRQSRGN
jgi:hypothetical protein